MVRVFKYTPTMKTLISILAVIIFFASSWYIGNDAMGTFGRIWQEQLMATFVGIFLWIVIMALCIFAYMIYVTVQETMK